MAERPRRTARRLLSRLERGVQNGLELARFGRLAPREGTSFDVVHADATYRLRRYAVDAAAPRRARCPLLLVPPLMVSSEVYDIEPALSAVAMLTRQGIDVFLVDFGAPEREAGGLSRTLDDHVRAVADAIGRARDLTGHDVHVAGYSQGGMFVYQAAAFRQSDGVASLITFGSPVDIHRNLPGFSPDALEPILRVAAAVVEAPLQRVEGLPGFLTSTGFKLLSVRKEAQQLVEFWRKLHDRDALVRRENRRRFLGGEGFVAWPGPALRKFVEELVVHNRLLVGGLVLDGRTVTMADVSVPILCFIGDRDEIVRPAAIRAVREAAPRAEVLEAHVNAGHFGLVVGSAAMSATWPTVVDWIWWRADDGPRPALLQVSGQRAPTTADEDDPDLDVRFRVDLVRDVVWDGVRGAWKRLGEWTEDAGEAADSFRYQVPRLRVLERMTGDTRTSLARALERRAASGPDDTFFLYHGRAFTYGQAQRRVDAVTRGLLSQGVVPGERVGVWMEGRPSFLTVVTALTRLGAVAVIVPPLLSAEGRREVLRRAEASTIVADPGHASEAVADAVGRVLVLGVGRAGPLPAEAVDLEAIDVDHVVVPAWFTPAAARARELALILVSRAADGTPRLQHVTHGRWAMSAYGAAAGCTLTPRDTVYTSLPLHHPTALLVAVGSAVVGGARLALGSPFSVSTFWVEVHRYGATVAFYAGDMIRPLVDAERRPLDEKSSLRLLAGSGMRRDVWERIATRFGGGVGVMEFYAATEIPLVVANPGEKVGAIGRSLPGSAPVVVAALDDAARGPRRDADGRARVAPDDTPGLLVARVDALVADGSVDLSRLGERVLRDLFAPGDVWVSTGDLAARDGEGDLTYVDRLSDVTVVEGALLSPRAVEDAALRVVGVARAAALRSAAGLSLVVELSVPVAEVRTELRRALTAAHPPGVTVDVRVIDSLPLQEGFRPDGAALRRLLSDLPTLERPARGRRSR